MKRVEYHPAYSSAKTVAFYVSFGSEVETVSLIKREVAEGVKKVIVPYVDGSNLGWVHVTDFSDLAPGKYGILEPKKELRRAQPADITSADVVIVPGLAWAPHKRGFARIGYGKGFYDRALSKINAPTIGVAFKEQVVPHIPVEESDMTVDYLVSDD
ncbi:5-formyltetrahydrofolate cyclo-ligase family protein [uncultured archaeon]|nr:5-formyltetrahydrofolate cyclo-ligase family protein [uncultured archaeon]